MYEKAMLWEMVEWQRNPMQLVEIKGISKRQKKPMVLNSFAERGMHERPGG
jgi:integrase